MLGQFQVFEKEKLSRKPEIVELGGGDGYGKG
jgi:hypothetical protein